ncbi:MAG: hypothetical protein AAF939_02475 [Planctomycetota bacterium]
MSSALTGLGFTDVETDCSKKSCSFKAPKGADVKTKIDEIASSANHLEGWSMVE